MRDVPTTRNIFCNDHERIFLSIKKVAFPSGLNMNNI